MQVRSRVGFRNTDVYRKSRMTDDDDVANFAE